MSYDLFFTLKGKPRPKASFFKWFEERPHYDIVEDSAEFRDPISLVYFQFNYEADNADANCWASFSINYLRPHFFADEAAAEVEQFVDAFKLTIDDAQDEMTDGKFSEALFLKGWNDGNAVAISAIVKRGDIGKFQSLPREVLHDMWLWNWSSNALRLAAMESNTAWRTPQIFVVETDDGPKTTAYWQDGLPCLLPKVNLICVARSPESDDGQPEGFLTPPDRLPPQLLKKFNKELNHYELDHDLEKSPPWVQKFFDFPPQPLELHVVPAEKLLDAEVVDEVLNPVPKPKANPKRSPPPPEPEELEPEPEAEVFEDEPPPPPRKAPTRTARALPQGRPAPATRGANQRPPTRSTGQRPALASRSGTRPGARSASGKRQAVPGKRNWLGLLALVVLVLIVLGVGGVFMFKSWATDKVEKICLEKGRMSLQNRANYSKYKMYYDRMQEKFHKVAFDETLAESKQSTLTGNMDYYVRALGNKIGAQAAKDGEKDVETTMKAMSAQITPMLGIP